MEVLHSHTRKVVVITGAAGGLGLGMVRRFLEEGFVTVATDLEAGLKQMRKENFSSDSNLFLASMDVTSLADVQRCANSVIKKYGRIDVLINNAGIFERTPLISQNAIDETKLEKIINVNLTGTLRCISVFSLSMIKQKSGRIINIASIAGERGAALASAYAASKGGVISATLSAARELGDFGINVNAIVPGYCDTPMLSQEKSLVDMFILPKIPKARLAKSDEISEVAYFLASSSADYLTGSVIRIDGGLSVG